ncbi:surface-adhesin E family protein [Paraburkholderia bryophila]|nr:surface-adhesin E family protein [Paraburkholderia bryophila]
MRIARSIGAGIGLVVAVSSAQATDWKMIFDDSKHTTYLNPAGIKKDADGHVLVWVLSDFTKHPLYDVNTNMMATRMIERDAIDCNLDRYRALSAQLYDPHGTNLGSPDLSTETFRDIPPDSAVAAVEQAACQIGK